MDKKQTLEKVAEKYGQQNASGYFVEQKSKAFIDGVKWQTEKVNELFDVLLNCNMCSVIGDELILKFKEETKL